MTESRLKDGYFEVRYIICGEDKARRQLFDTGTGGCTIGNMKNILVWFNKQWDDRDVIILGIRKVQPVHAVSVQ